MFLGHYSKNILAIILEIIFRFLRDKFGTIHPVLFTRHYSSDFYGMYLVLILAKREGFLGGYSINFQQQLKG
jgi:hypothetical protein